MKRLDRLLTATLIEQSQALFNRIKEVLTTDIRDLPDLMRHGHRKAHRSGALYGLLGLKNTTPDETTMKAVQTRVVSATDALEGVARNVGLELTITKASVIEKIDGQAQIASEILQKHFLEGKAGTEARAAGYAVRWSVQEGVKDAAENSVATQGDEIAELQKTWVRLATRAEHREHHDKLEGLTIPYSHKFRLVGPNGTFLVDRPYDPKLPLNEKIGCGHGLRVSAPKNATVTPWRGD
jgi:hypothetical protein